MNPATELTESLIAPCGMNCALCMAYQREKKSCPGCNVNSETKSKSCASCRIKNCEELKATHSNFCFSCSKFPCLRLRQLDKRYVTKYGMSMLVNLGRIRDEGMTELIRSETEKWVCRHCGTFLSVHKEFCLRCGNSNSYVPPI